MLSTLIFTVSKFYVPSLNTISATPDSLGLNLSQFFPDFSKIAPPIYTQNEYHAEEA